MHRKIRDQFAVTLRTAEGHQFRGEFGNPGAYPRPRKEIQNLPHRALVTSRAALAKAGDLVRFAGVQYLLAGQHVLKDTKRFLAVEINATATWERLTEVVDPVTKMKKDDVLQTLDAALPITLEPQRSFEEEKFTVSQMRAFTAADVQTGDLINGMKVLRSDDLFGIRMLEIA